MSTVTNIAARVQTAVGDLGGIYMKDNYILDWVNEAVRDIFINMDPDPNAAIVDISLAVGGNSWEATNPIYKIHNMSIVDSYTEIEEKPLSQIIDEYGWTWATTDGTPKYYYRSWTPGGTGAETIKFAQPTDKAITIKMSCSLYPTLLASTAADTATVLPEHFVDDIVRFCVMRAHEREKDFQAAQTARDQYLELRFQRNDMAHRLDTDFYRISPDPNDYL